MSYDVLSLTAAELADLGNAPALAIPPYLLETKQTSLLRVISNIKPGPPQADA
jgi:hypothetical protein